MRRPPDYRDTWVTLAEAAEILGVGHLAMLTLAQRGSQLEILSAPRARISRETGQRIEYVLRELEDVLAHDAEMRLLGAFDAGQESGL